MDIQSNRVAATLRPMDVDAGTQKMEKSVPGQKPEKTTRGKKEVRSTLPRVTKKPVPLGRYYQGDDRPLL